VFQTIFAYSLSKNLFVKKALLVIDDNPYFWTEPFVIWFQGEYILHWKNDNAGIDFKQTFTVTDHVSQQQIQVKGGRLKG